jgi:hypothetical protein
MSERQCKEILEMMLWNKALWTTPEWRKANCAILHFLLDHLGAQTHLGLICHHPHLHTTFPLSLLPSVCI